jgi:hypothetical protein
MTLPGRLGKLKNNNNAFPPAYGGNSLVAGYFFTSVLYFSFTSVLYSFPLLFFALFSFHFPSFLYRSVFV